MVLSTRNDAAAALPVGVRPAMAKRRKNERSGRPCPDEREDRRWARVVETIDDLRRYDDEPLNRKD